jgi:hypothetical protein
MSLTLASLRRIELVAGHEVLPVAALGNAVISLRGRLTDAAAPLRDFTLWISDGASHIRVPFQGEVEPNRGEVVVAEPDRATVLAAASLATDGPRHEALRSLVTRVGQRATRRQSSTVKLLAIAACVVLGAYVGLRLLDKLTFIDARVAYLATDVTTLLSPTSGRVTFLENLGSVEAGQPAVGIETTSGKSLLIDAPDDVDVVAAEKTVGDRVKRGDPLLAYALPDAPLYLHAVVDRDQAFRIAEGTRVHYARLGDASTATTLDVPASDLRVRALPAGTGGQLYEVRIPVAAGDEQFRALPVQLRFEQDFVSSVSDALRPLGLLEPLLDGFAAIGGGAR